MKRALSIKLPTSSTGSYKYCLDHVKKFDRENYLAAICLGDPSLRRAVVALRAFNVELSLVRDLTSSAETAKIRFHFWSKLVDQMASPKQTSQEKLSAYRNYSPVANELLGLFRMVELDPTSRQWLYNLIGARVSSKARDHKPFLTLEELEVYCSKSSSSIYHLAFLTAGQLFNVPQSSTTSSVAHSLGLAQGLSNIIRSIPYNSTKNYCYLPQDLLDDHKLSWRDLVRPNLDEARIAPAVRDLALRCQTLLDSVSESYNCLPVETRGLVLNRVAVQAYLNRLKRYNYNVSHVGVARRNELLPLNLWLASKLGGVQIFR